MTWDDPRIADLIRRALDEDVGTGDVTTNSCVPEDTRAKGFFLTRQKLVLAGTPLLPLVYRDCSCEILAADGDVLESDVVIARISGSARQLLTLERTALNLVQRTCGIATVTRRYVDAVQGTGCAVLDTRKTAPGMRLLDKLSVRVGGGTNHRMGLHDAVLIKNNHIDAAGGLRQAVEASRTSGLSIEVEVRNLAELDEALACGVSHVLLDNFDPAQVAFAVDRIGGRAKTEVSGGVTLNRIREYAEAGADCISVGALTHSVPAADISFRIG